MPIGQDLINFSSNEDWELIVDLSQSVITSENGSFIPFDSFDLGATVESIYMVAVVTVDYRKPKWDFAGNLQQTYDYAPLSSSDGNQKVSLEAVKLFIDIPIFIDAATVSREAFGLRYTPPTWFKDFNLKVYKYTGEVENAVETTFTEIASNISCEGIPTTGSLIAEIQKLSESILEVENRLCLKLEALSDRFEKCIDPTFDLPKANGIFKPSKPEENLVNAYFKGFL